MSALMVPKALRKNGQGPQEFFSFSPDNRWQDHFVFVTAITEAWRKGPVTQEDEGDFPARISVAIAITFFLLFYSVSVYLVEHKAMGFGPHQITLA